jgi:predicted PurR-regulated permease PerM
MVLGREIKLHPVTIIIVLLIGAEFGGILGMIVAVPIAAIISTTHQWYRELVEANEEPL